MAMSKCAKLTIVVTCFFTLMLLVMLVQGLCFYVCYCYSDVFSDYLPRYIEREPDKMIAQLEKIFAISFPDRIKELRTARTGIQWDGCVNFVIKFAAEPNVVDSFLNIKHVEPYSPDRDGRKEKGAMSLTPKWFTEPIKHGRMGDINLEARNEKIAETTAGQSGHIYIDTSDQKNFVVYIDSAYDVKWER